MDMAQQIEETLKRKDELERQTDGRGQQQTQPPRCGAADGDEDKDDAGNCRGVDYIGTIETEITALLRVRSDRRSLFCPRRRQSVREPRPYVFPRHGITPREGFITFVVTHYCLIRGAPSEVH
jgi:hypothetical protein